MRVTALVKIKASHFCDRAAEYKNINEFTLVDHDKIDKNKFYIDKKRSRIIFNDTTFLMFNSYADLVANLEAKVIKWVEKKIVAVWTLEVDGIFQLYLNKYLST